MPITVGRINTTTIKGCALQQPQQVTLTSSGVADNRRFFLIDENDSLINGKKAGGLVQLRVKYSDADNQLSIIRPDGSRLKGEAILTDKEVTTNFYGRPVKGTLVDPLWNTWLSQVAGVSVQLVHADPANTATDVHPVTLISDATLEAVRTMAKGPVTNWGNRFRMLFELHGLEPFQEEAWAGQSITVGEALLHVIGPVPRCVITTHNPETGESDFGTLHALKAMREKLEKQGDTFADPLPESGRLMLGMYATVEKPGRVEAGSTVELSTPTPN